MKKLILLKADPYYISSRIKEVDEGYFLVYNTQKSTYELHNKNQQFNTYALTIPFSELDERTIFLARKTRRENIYKLIAEMDEENEYRKRVSERAAKEQIKEVLNENKRYFKA